MVTYSCSQLSSEHIYKFYSSPSFHLFNLYSPPSYPTLSHVSPPPLPYFNLVPFQLSQTQFSPGDRWTAMITWGVCRGDLAGARCSMFILKFSLSYLCSDVLAASLLWTAWLHEKLSEFAHWGWPNIITADTKINWNSIAIIWWNPCNGHKIHLLYKRQQRIIPVTSVFFLFKRSCSLTETK